MSNCQINYLSGATRGQFASQLTLQPPTISNLYCDHLYFQQIWDISTNRLFSPVFILDIDHVWLLRFFQMLIFDFPLKELNCFLFNLSFHKMLQEVVGLVYQYRNLWSWSQRYLGLYYICSRDVRLLRRLSGQPTRNLYFPWLMPWIWIMRQPQIPYIPYDCHRQSIRQQ